MDDVVSLLRFVEFIDVIFQLVDKLYLVATEDVVEGLCELALAS